MENIAVIFGGKSVEHDISIITALQVMAAMPKQYNVIPLYCRSDGIMVTAENLADANVYLDYAKNVKKESQVAFKTGHNKVYFLNKNKIKKVVKLDAAILCNHGHGGEDGSLQGLLEMCEIPYTSPGVTSSAICMDKAFTKMALKEFEIPTPAYVQLNKCQYAEKQAEILQNVGKSLGFPCIVKPARCGSSVGISICESETEFEGCIENAFVYDDKVVIEEFIDGAREFFCAVVDISGKAVASKIDEAVKTKFYSFEEKYLEKKKHSEIKIAKALEKEIRARALQTYQALECKGVVRVDFLMDGNKQLYVNEVNTIPGSLAFNLFESNFEDLLNALIISAKKRVEDKSKVVYQFNSSAIENFIKLQGCSKSSK